MTTQELIDYYANLLILQYIGKPKAYATIQTLVTGVVMDQLPTQVEDAFNLNGSDPAVGVQLDTLGKYAGVTRSGYGFYGPITLDDADFLTLIQMAIIRNSSGSSLSDIQDILHRYFPGDIFVYDYQNMHMSYLINSALGSADLVQLFITEGLLPKPMGVQLATVIYAPVIDSFFGFRTYELAGFRNKPFNTYDDFHYDWIWLSYADSASGGTKVAYFNLVTSDDGDTLVTDDGDTIVALLYL